MEWSGLKITIAKGGLSVGTWNYRVIQHIAPRAPDEPYYVFHEVHYDGAGRIRGWTKNGADIGGETIAEIRAVLARMRRALRQPILKIQGKDLIEVKTGKPACGVPVKRLPRKKRMRLKSTAALIENETRRRQQTRTPST